MDGFQATAAVRRLPNGRGAVPIIAMTAHAMQGDRQRCLEAGMDDYISKPVDGQRLIELVERLGDRAEDGMPRQAPDVVATPSPRDVPAGETPAPQGDGTGVFSGAFNRDEALRRCLGEQSMFEEMVECFFCEAEPLIQQAQAALSRGSAADAGRAAHRLKGTVCYLGAAPAMAALQRLEQIGKSGDLNHAPEALQQLEVQIGLLSAELSLHRPASASPR
jgi:CheY-like chemotaxis protein